MTTIKETLTKLATIDGFLAAALVDSDGGTLLGSEQRSTLNMEVASAGNTEVVRAKRKAQGDRRAAAER